MFEFLQLKVVCRFVAVAKGEKTGTSECVSLFEFLQLKIVSRFVAAVKEERDEHLNVEVCLTFYSEKSSIDLLQLPKKKDTNV